MTYEPQVIIPLYEYNRLLEIERRSKYSARTRVIPSRLDDDVPF